MYCYRILSVFKHIYNVVFRRKFSKELLSLKNVAFLKKVGSNCQYNVKSDMDYSHLVVFIILIIYLSIYFTPCFYFGLLAWLLRTMPLLRKLKNRLLGLNHVVFSEKIEDRTFGFLKHNVFFMTLLVNDNIFQKGREKCCMSSPGKNSEMDYLV